MSDDDTLESCAQCSGRLAHPQAGSGMPHMKIKLPTTLDRSSVQLELVPGNLVTDDHQSVCRSKMELGALCWCPAWCPGTNSQFSRLGGSKSSAYNFSRRDCNLTIAR